MLEQDELITITQRRVQMVGHDNLPVEFRQVLLHNLLNDALISYQAGSLSSCSRHHAPSVLDLNIGRPRPKKIQAPRLVLLLRIPFLHPTWDSWNIGGIGQISMML